MSGIWEKLTEDIVAEYKLDPSYKVICVGVEEDIVDDRTSVGSEIYETQDDFLDIETAVDKALDKNCYRVTPPDGFCFVTLKAENLKPVLVMLSAETLKETDA